MSTTCSLTIESDITKEDREAIEAGLTAYNKSCVGEPNFEPLTITIRNQDGNIVGGLLGACRLGWLHVGILWMDESLRGSGYGSKVLSMAEEEAARRGCKHVHLDTFSFQALPFYQKQGYRVFGELPDYPEGHTRYYLTKKLSAAGD